MSLRIFLRCITVGALACSAVMAFALLVIWDQSRTKRRAWSR